MERYRIVFATVKEKLNSSTAYITTPMHTDRQKWVGVMQKLPTAGDGQRKANGVSMNPIVLVTGGSRGLGAATSKYLARKGYSVCVNYFSNEIEANKVVDEIKNNGGTAISVQADVSKEEDVIRLFNTIDQSLGRITHLVNNVGILLPQMCVSEMTAERINKVLTTNVTSYFLCCKEVVTLKKLLLPLRFYYQVKPHLLQVRLLT